MPRRCVCLSCDQANEIGGRGLPMNQKTVTFYVHMPSQGLKEEMRSEGND